MNIEFDGMNLELDREGALELVAAITSNLHSAHHTKSTRVFTVPCKAYDPELSGTTPSRLVVTITP